MSKFIEGLDRSQGTLFPERLDDYVEEENPVRVIDVFIDDLDISGLGFKAEPAATGRPGYHPKTMLKLYVYGYLNRVQSSRRLEVEAQRNIELMWLTGRLAPDFKTIADFRKDNPEAIRLVCREFVMLCKKLNLLEREAGGDRRQQVQGGEQSGQELHAGEDEAPAAGCGVGHRALPGAAWTRPTGPNRRRMTPRPCRTRWPSSGRRWRA